MTEREEIDILRRLVADLTERVRVLEARPTTPSYPAPYAPYLPPVQPITTPWRPFPPVTCGDDLNRAMMVCSAPTAD